ncbi:MAG: flagellar basal body P-ring protein FlgI [Alphaproteobacteria bacterium]|nr:flagellar basal body P-ring protein FlgI [Alphaproteobacteria bacterium]
MKKPVAIVTAALLAVMPCLAPLPVHATSRIKDIVTFEGVRENMLMGYGLVVGLNGTGDKLNNNAFTEQSLVAFLERLGVNTRGAKLQTKNVAAVTVTATLPAFSRQGSKVNVTVSALGDAKSLQGGTLLATPLYAADGEVYAVAQGPLAISGFTATGQSGTTVTKNTPTTAYIANGGIVEREVGFELSNMQQMNISLRNPDISTARRIATAINQQLGVQAAKVMDSATVNLAVPDMYRGDVAGLMGDIEQLQVEPDQVARIVIDEASGTIVMGENVRIDTVAVAQGNLVVRVDETPQVSQPNPLAPEGAQTVVVPRTDINVDENAQNKMAVLPAGATLRDLVKGLNALGVGPRDLITILQTIKAAGALQADIQTR